MLWKYEVIVSNIGTVYAGNYAPTAIITYDRYVHDYARRAARDHAAGHRRWAGEQITLLRDGTLWQEWTPQTVETALKSRTQENHTHETV